jgi:ATP-dependent Clp protease protease subunit
MPLPKNIRAESTPQETLIHIDGEIGAWDWDTGASRNDAPWLRELLAATGAPVVRVVINSPGGDAFAGVALHSALRDCGRRVITEVSALAASAASVVFMAGDERRMPAGTLIMIHNAATCASGESADLAKTAALLAKLSGQLAEIYAKATGNTVATVAAWMDDETWFTDAEALQHNFATHRIPNAHTARFAPVALARFRHAPASLTNKIKNNMSPETLHTLGLEADATAEKLAAEAAEAAMTEAALLHLREQTPRAPAPPAAPTPAPKTAPKEVAAKRDFRPRAEIRRDGDGRFPKTTGVHEVNSVYADVVTPKDNAHHVLNFGEPHP